MPRNDGTKKAAENSAAFRRSGPTRTGDRLHPMRKRKGEVFLFASTRYNLQRFPIVQQFGTFCRKKPRPTAEAQPFLSTKMTLQRYGKILHVRTDDEVTRAVVAEQRAAHAVVHVADLTYTDWDEVTCCNSICYPHIPKFRVT